LLVGVDLEKDPTLLERTYDDAQGVTAAFDRIFLPRCPAAEGPVASPVPTNAARARSTPSSRRAAPRQARRDVSPIEPRNFRVGLQPIAAGAVLGA
jgi:hypothetical protein